jgi:hypothetical protein
MDEGHLFITLDLRIYGHNQKIENLTKIFNNENTFYIKYIN